MGHRLIGCTDYCQIPAGKMEPQRMGGTKNPKRREILALKPDLILCNKEENRLVDVEWFQAQGVELFINFPRTPLQALSDIETLAQSLGIGQAERMAARFASVRTRIEHISSSPRPHKPSFFVAVWKSPWMTANAGTYISALLELSGARNVFAERQRRFPLAFELGLTATEDPPDGRDTRYPRLSLTQLATARPDIILLLSEPYPFDSTHIEELLVDPDLIDVPAIRNRRIHLLEGRLLTWHSLGWLEAALTSLENGELAAIFSTDSHSP